MHAFLSRHLPPRVAAALALVWYTLLMVCILVCYHRNSPGFLYQHL